MEQIAVNAPKRNGYIDVIKFIFALFIMEFPLGTGVFPGGRVAVEGFFMISGYLMMKNIERNRYPDDNLGVSTVRFVANKYKALFPFLLPSVLLSYAISCRVMGRDLIESISSAPLLLFELFPLREAGYKGIYPIGISWYLGAMFLALAILYPLCKKFKASFTLTVCPLLALILYGTLSHFYGNLAVASDWLDGELLSSGLLRGLAGCAAGCVIYEICEKLSCKTVSNIGRTLFTILEAAGFVYLLYGMHYKPKSHYDYVLVFVIFGLLIIGIGRLSFSSFILSGKWTQVLGTLSTLIVVNHYRINIYLQQVYDAEYAKTDKIWIYFACLVVLCAVAWALSKLVSLIMKKASKIKIFK